MTLEDARKMAQEDADNYQVVINIVYDKLEEYPVTDDGEDNRYGFCAVEAMDIMFPQNLSDFWNIVEVVKPKKNKKFVRR
jgi:hypothetical protein